MQSRREFFARLAVLCGAAAAVPIAAKALTVENLSAAIAEVAHQCIEPTCILYIRGAGEEWIKVAAITDPIFVPKFRGAFPPLPANGFSISCTFTHDLKPGQLLNW